ncbi:hypothetical protein [Achromobacter animicus]|nr:hypothetical protein [Achromobacter animicus]
MHQIQLAMLLAAIFPIPVEPAKLAPGNDNAHIRYPVKCDLPDM